MKKIIYSLLVLSAAVLTACSDDKYNDVTPTATGTVTDNEGNVYNWVQIGNQQWTTFNAKNGDPIGDMTTVGLLGRLQNVFSDSEKAEIEENYMPVHGNLMTIEEALKSAPEGWRLPTDEDWQRLEASFGAKNTDDKGLRFGGIVDYLMDNKGLSLTLGGAIMMNKTLSNSETVVFARRDAMGYYWTSTEDTDRDDPDNVYYYYRRIDTFTGSIDRESTVSNTRFSVRWVRDVK